MDFIVENYVWFIIGGITILMAVVGYIADITDFGRKKLKDKEVKEVKEKEVVIDANHPLAGETLYFDVEIVSVRAATSEEIAAILAPRGGCGGGCGGCGGGCGDDCNCDDDCSCGGCGN